MQDSPIVAASDASRGVPEAWRGQTLRDASGAWMQDSPIVAASNASRAMPEDWRAWPLTK